jgi:hypothetical protein
MNPQMMGGEALPEELRAIQKFLTVAALTKAE